MQHEEYSVVPKFRDGIAQVNVQFDMDQPLAEAVADLGRRQSPPMSRNEMIVFLCTTATQYDRAKYIAPSSAHASEEDPAE